MLDNPNTDDIQRQEIINALKIDEGNFDSIAACDKTPFTILKELYENFVNNTTEDEFVKVISNRYQVLLVLAKNESTPVDILASLAADRDTDFREAVARNPSTDAETMVRLSK